MVTGPCPSTALGGLAQHERGVDLVLVEPESVAGGRVRDQIGAELGLTPDSKMRSGRTPAG
jgi:hypothetical protein